MASTPTIREFFIEGSDRQHAHVLLHISEPSPEEAERKGCFFAIIEMKNATMEQITHMQEIIDTVESQYYLLESLESKSAFERALEKANRRSHHLTEGGAHGIHCFLGVLEGKKITFSVYGQPSANLFYRKQGALENVSLVEEGAVRGSQLFDAITEGVVNEGDMLIICTPRVHDYIPIAMIRGFLSEHGIDRAREKLEHLLLDAKTSLSFGGMFIATPQKNEEAEEMKGGADSAAQEPATPPFAARIREAAIQDKKKQARALPRGAYETNYRPRERGNVRDESLASSLLLTVGKGIVFGLLAILRCIKYVLVLTGKFLVFLFFIITNKSGQRQTVLDDARMLIREKRGRIAALPLMSKALFVLAIIAALVFTASISTIRVREARQAKQQAYELMVKDVNDTFEQAQGKIIYADDAAAIALLNGALAKTQALPEESDEQQSIKQRLQENIRAKLQTLRKLETVNGAPIADFSTQLTLPMTSLTLLDRTLLLAGADIPDLRIYNLDSKETVTRESGRVPNLGRGTTPKEQDVAIFLSGTSDIAAYDKETGALSAKEIMFPNANVSLADIKIYNRKLYVLDTQHQQIYKHNFTQLGFDKGTEWLKEPHPLLSDAVSFTIDGDMYILLKNGTVLKLAKGMSEPFTILGVEPALASPTRIATFPDMERMYILDPGERRIVILGKDGKLIKQLTHPDWKEPNDMAVDNDHGLAYVLDGNKIYAVNVK